MKKNRVIQFGSGKPGEMGTSEMEISLFKSLGYKNPALLYIPFHHLTHGETNDWTLLQSLYQPLTEKKIILKEFFDDFEVMEDIRKEIKQADIIILGSGIVEYFVALLGRHHMDRCFKEAFLSGKDFFGYSAGSIYSSEAYIHPVLLHEIYFYIRFFLQGTKHLSKSEKKRAKEGFLLDLKNEMAPQTDFGLIEPFFEIDCPVPKKNSVLDVIRMPCLNLTPGYTVFPHFGEYIHCTPEHLKAVTKIAPNLTHLGIPNGMAVIHEFDMGAHNLINSRVFGQRGDLSLTYYDELGNLIEIGHDEVL